MSDAPPAHRLPPPADAVAPIAARLNLAARVAPFHDRRWRPNTAPVPTLHLEDVSAIPFLVDIAGVEEYQHRARVRTDPGDLYATVTRGDRAYDAYCRETLGLGDATRLDLSAARGSSRLAIAKRCLHDRVFDRLVATARRHGGLLIHPYMSIGPVWELAARLHEAAECPVAVLGPPPPVTWVANDKARFDEVVEAVLGDGWTAETLTGTTTSGIAGNLIELAARHDTVGLKRTRCASAMGNQIFDGRALRSAPRPRVERMVDDFLDRTEWPAGETVLAVVWEDAVCSPSTQWWIPPAGTGAPRLDGIYEQILEGDRQVFVGSRPSTLPAAVHETLARATGRVAAALQTLGYVGRCSFDHLVRGDPAGEFVVRFTECNGRWGGTSTPMHLVDRLVTRHRGTRPCYRAQDLTLPGLRGTPVSELLRRAGGELFDPTRGTGRFIFYNLGPLEDLGKFDVVAFGESPADADEAILDRLPRLLEA